MIKSELIARIAEQNPHLFVRDVEAVVRTILDRIALALADGDRVELRDFGAFSIRDRDARPARSPRTGKPVVAKAKAHIYFKPGKGMRARLNLEKVDPDQAAEQLLHTELRLAAATWPAR